MSRIIDTSDSRLGVWSAFTYKTRMTFAFALIAAMTALVAMGIVSFVWEQYFRMYTADSMQAIAQNTANHIEKVYKQSDTLNVDSMINTAAQVANLYPDLAVKITDTHGTVLYDSSYVLQEGTSSAALSFEPNDPTRVARAAIMVGDQHLGTVSVWSYNTDTLMSRIDKQFRDNSYHALFIAAIISIVLASCIGFLFARNLVAPIGRITSAASAIKEGNLSARTDLHGEDEIARLGEQFDAMADSVEKDRLLERRLTTDVAHELRTPLMAIQATVEAMVDGVYEADEERLITVNSEVQRLSRLVDALLRLSRLENRSEPLKEEVLNLKDLVGSIVSTHEMYVTESGLTFDYIAENNVWVTGDADLLRQATANLISNAVRYTPEGGRIEVSVTSGELMGNIAVKDTGIGLTRDEAKMVFSRFWRADAGRNRESGGLGVGLAVVKEIVDRHGGWVQVEGEKGVGACFTIHIPLYVESQQKPQRQKRDNTTKKTRNKLLS